MVFIKTFQKNLLNTLEKRPKNVPKNSQKISQNVQKNSPKHPQNIPEKSKDSSFFKGVVGFLYLLVGFWYACSVKTGNPGLNTGKNQVEAWEKVPVTSFYKR